MGRVRTALGVAVLAVLVGVSGCGMGGGVLGASGSPEITDPAAEVARRPSFEEAGASYLRMLTEMRAVIDANAPGVRWERAAPFLEQVSQGEDPPFQHLDDVYLGRYDAGGETVGVVPEERWPAVKSGIVAVAARYGFTEVIVFSERAGRHEFAVKGPYDAGVDVMSTDRVGLYMKGGSFRKASPGRPTLAVPPGATTTPLPPDDPLDSVDPVGSPRDGTSSAATSSGTGTGTGAG